MFYGIWPSFTLSDYISLCTSVFLFVRPSVCLSVHLLVYQFVYLPVFQSVNHCLSSKRIMDCGVLKESILGPFVTIYHVVSNNSPPGCFQRTQIADVLDIKPPSSIFNFYNLNLNQNSFRMGLHFKHT